MVFNKDLRLEFAERSAGRERLGDPFILDILYSGKLVYAKE